MNKSSVVVDGHTVSYWKYQLINKLYTENNLEKIYITNYDDFSLVLSLNRIVCKNLFKITISELFEDVERISVIESSQYSGNLIWLSEKPIDFTYGENIIYFSNENSVQKFEKSYYGQNLDKFKFITYLTQRNKSKNKIINVSWTEEAKFSESKSISKHLESLKFLITNSNTEISTNYKKLMLKPTSVSVSRVTSLTKKIYSLIFNYPSWSIYTYPKILDICLIKIDPTSLEIIKRGPNRHQSCGQGRHEADPIIRKSRAVGARGLGSLDSLDLFRVWGRRVACAACMARVAPADRGAPAVVCT